MVSKSVVWAGEDANRYNTELLGGKGINLLRLYDFAKRTGLVEVPNFFIVPTDIRRGSRVTRDREESLFYDDEVSEPFSKLSKPVMVRSSSPLEDGIRATFAGMFDSFDGVYTYDQFGIVAHSVYWSAFRGEVERYAKRMEIPLQRDMALIVQEQVTNFQQRGIIQLERNRAITEETERGNIFRKEIEYEFLDKLFAKERNWRPTDLPLGKDFPAEIEDHFAVLCAREAKKQLALDGVVQVEFLLAPSKLPYFVQIRELPKVNSLQAQLDLDVPKDVAYIESEICNGVPGDLSLPAYVTISQSGIKKILIETGQGALVGLGDIGLDPRVAKFMGTSLGNNHDFLLFRDYAVNAKSGGDELLFYRCEREWENGNKLFPDYILICDKLDEGVIGMTRLTANKKAIITCLEAKETSHAMTVARDLGIMAMGVNGNINDPKYFFNQVETGDFVRMKSDGRRAVAYIERRRDRDPYAAK